MKDKYPKASPARIKKKVTTCICTTYIQNCTECFRHYNKTKETYEKLYRLKRSKPPCTQR